MSELAVLMIFCLIFSIGQMTDTLMDLRDTFENENIDKSCYSGDRGRVVNYELKKTEGGIRNTTSPISPIPLSKIQFKLPKIFTLLS